MMYNVVASLLSPPLLFIFYCQVVESDAWSGEADEEKSMAGVGGALRGWQNEVQAGPGGVMGVGGARGGWQNDDDDEEEEEGERREMVSYIWDYDQSRWVPHAGEFGGGTRGGGTRAKPCFCCIFNA